MKRRWLPGIALLVLLGILCSCEKAPKEEESVAEVPTRIVGVSPWSNPDYGLMKEAGIGWVRLGFAFPFKNEIGGELSEKFLEDLDEAKKVREQGLRIMGITPLAGTMSFDKSDSKTDWRSRIPTWAGPIDSDSYYETYEKACEEIGRRTQGLVELWQVSNEMDIDVFRGPMSIEQAARFLNAGARGLKKGNPDSKPGINPASLGSQYGEWLFQRLYSEPSCPFDYAGIDGYYGSWAKGGPEDWVPVLDRIYQITGKPVLVNEWGYSSLQGSGVPLDRNVGNKVCETQSWNNVWRKGHTEEEQADYVEIALKIFATYPHVMGSFFYDWGDDPICYHCGQSGCPSECGWGIVNSQGKPKSAFFTFKKLTGEYY